MAQMDAVGVEMRRRPGLSGGGAGGGAAVQRELGAVAAVKRELGGVAAVKLQAARSRCGGGRGRCGAGRGAAAGSKDCGGAVGARSRRESRVGIDGLGKGKKQYVT